MRLATYPRRGHPCLSQRRVTYLLALGLVGFVGLAGCGDHERHSADHSVPTQLAADNTPRLAEYRDVLLPVAEPPAGALVESTSFADPERSGQNVLFEYDGFTISACTVDQSAADPTACATDSTMHVFRSARSSRFVTKFTVSTKDPKVVLPSGAQSAVAFFRIADLATRPAWMSHYAERELKDRYLP